MSSDSENKAWGGRFRQPVNAQVERMNASIAFDQKLALEDIAGSIAHSRMLKKTGILTPDEQAQIESGLIDIATSVRQGTFVFTMAREDVHMNVEGALSDAIGAVAGKLHSGRSRNDQVALDLRLWLRRELTELGDELATAFETLLELGHAHQGVPMPGYTHLQRAQPVTFGHHMMAYGAMFSRDIDRLLDARKRAAILPLGSGALAGTPLAIDRHAVAKELEMPGITENSLDAVSDRDAAMESLAALAIVMVHVSRLAEELVLWCSQEFGFIELSDSFCTGSSLMPQKKNPDIPELLRGKAGRVFGDLQALLTVMKGLPLAYNKDMQEDKEPLFDAFDTVHTCVRILPELLQAMTLRKDAMAGALKDGFLLATDLADYLVEKDVPFREAHHVAGHAVAYCLEHGKRLEDLELDELKSLNEAFDEGVLAILDPIISLEKRDQPGSPAPVRTEEAVASGRKRLASMREALKKDGPSALERALLKGAALPPASS